MGNYRKKKRRLKKKELEELVDMDGKRIKGDDKTTPNTEIKSKKTTDDKVSSTTQNMKYPYGYHAYSRVRGNFSESEVNLQETAKDKMKGMVEDILNRNRDRRGNNDVINDNPLDIPEFETLETEHGHPILHAKVVDFLDLFYADRGVNEEETAIVLKKILSTLDLTKLPARHKKELRDLI